MDYTNNHTKEDITEFYQRYSPMVYRVCFSFLKNPSDSADMMQETFLKWITCKSPPSGEKHEIAWLVTVAGNLCRNLIKSRKRRKTCQLSETDITVDFNSDTNIAVTNAVFSLPDKYKTVVYLFYFEELSVADISEATNLKQPTVLSQLYRARNILKSKLGDEYNV